MPLSAIRIVLVEPLYGGNVGSVCRAMANTGLTQLTIVGSPDRLDLAEARKMAFRAADRIDRIRYVANMAEAVSDCGLVAGTTARMGLYRAHARTPREWAPDLLAASESSAVALVFGREDKGLNNEEIALCTQIVQIPSAPEYLSLNLAQAVMICAYELFLASGRFEPVEEKYPEAPSELRERMFAMWEQALKDIGFMKDEKAEHMMLGLRRILSRGTLTEADVRILMGIARQTQWCARQVRKDANRHTPPVDSAGDPTG